ncbi:hypothetical protein KKI23_04220, partial [Patescibacteria group bacterium]|nr:hypothetical protein [Patescibacteria group bacterium]
ILVVEDELINAIPALMAFDGEEFDVHTASSFEMAQEMIRGGEPDLALLDIHILGGGTGKDIAGILKEKGVPYLFVTKIVDGHVQDGKTAIEIRDDNEVIVRLEKTEKDEEVWRIAYKKLKEKMETSIFQGGQKC